MQFETLGCPADSGPLREQRLDGLECLAKPVARYRDEDVADALEALVEFDDGFEVIGECRAGEVAGIHAILAHLRELGVVAPPQPYRPPAAGELQRQRGAPGTRADDGHRL